MGTWGTGLYSDDEALDLKGTIALLAEMPIDGEKLYQLICTQSDVADTSNPAFWLVMADQFEKHGLAHPHIFESAIGIIKKGEDIAYLRDHDMSAANLKKRQAMLDKLLVKLESPRPLRKINPNKKPPDSVVEVGQVYTFPTMELRAMSAWFKNWEEAKFKPNGWGAFVVVAQGRLFDWHPWCAVISLTVPNDRPIMLDETIALRTASRQGAYCCIPKKNHFERIQAQLIGQLPIDGNKGEAIIYREHTPKYAVMNGWSICSVISGWSGTNYETVTVKSLLK